MKHASHIQGSKVKNQAIFNHINSIQIAKRGHCYAIDMKVKYSSIPINEGLTPSRPMCEERLFLLQEKIYTNKPTEH